MSYKFFSRVLKKPYFSRTGINELFLFNQKEEQCLGCCHKSLVSNRFIQYIVEQQATIFRHQNFSRTAYYRTFRGSLLPILNIVKFLTSAECSRQRRISILDITCTSCFVISHFINRSTTKLFSRIYYVLFPFSINFSRSSFNNNQSIIQ